MKRFYAHLMLLICLGLPFLLKAQTAEFDQWPDQISGYGGQPMRIEFGCFSRATAATVSAKWNRIATEIGNSSTDEWAGEYTFGSEGEGTHETRVRWAPDAGFVILGIYSCHPMVTDLGWGKVSFDAQRLIFTPVVILDQILKEGHPTHSYCGHVLQRLSANFIPVKWGSAHYLVPEPDLKAFCEEYVAGLSVNVEGQEPRDIMPLIKHAERGENLEKGLPILPPKYSHLVKSPIDVEISAIISESYKSETNDSLDEFEVKAKVNVGKKSGLKKGMILKVVGSTESDRFVVVKVTKDFSIVVTHRAGDEIKELTPIASGLRLSTSSFPH